MLEQSSLKYLQIRDLLVEQFRKQRMQPETKLPTELELTRNFGVSRTTIRQALRMLEQDGIIEKRHGSGAFFVGHTRRKSLLDKHKGTIGMINFYSMDYIYPEIIRGIEDAAAERGFFLTLTNCNMDYKREMDSVEALLEQGVRGLILEPSRSIQMDEWHPVMRMIRERGVAVVSTHWGRRNPGLSTATIDDGEAGLLATRYLIAKGHRRIAMIYKRDVEAGSDRYEGYLGALAEANIQTDESLVLAYDRDDEVIDFEQGSRLTRHLLEANRANSSLPTAVFYFNDRLALQGYRTIRELGFRIPEDISVIGFDDYHTSAVVRPALTTFEHPKYQLGRWAALLLCDGIELGESMVPTKIVFQPRIIERDSVASPATFR